VTLVLRLIRQPRWDSPGKYDWLAEGDIPADPLADFANTSENCLSVWLVDDDKKELDDVVAALAASREKADKLDYVLFTESHLKLTGIEVSATRGSTPDEHVNGRHRDLSHLSAAKVLALTTRVWNENLELRRIDESRVVQLVAAAVRRGRISLAKLRPKLRDDVRFCLDDKRDDVRKPK
jgi:hypothetical protein